jgi:hypothetical protein
MGMIEISLLAWLKILLLVLFSSMAGIGVSRVLPWTTASRNCRLNLAFGIALGPFFAGIASVIALLLFPGASHSLHTFCAFIFLGLGALLNFKPFRAEPVIKLQSEMTGILLIGMLLAWVALLLINAVSIPLLQNDALEYATVGREIFHVRSLVDYPLLNSESNLSGFFAPWTHPPLYVSMIYMVSVLQGHADEPGLMRLIAPWFLITAVYMTVKLGKLRGPNIGVLAGLLMISTPLLFLGADSALIDALPVSGMVLLLASMTGLNTSHRLYGTVLGGVLGLTLWTHSQAILFIPLVAAAIAFQYGLRGSRKSARTGAVGLVAALLIGGWPYLRNFLLFGSPVSDTPAVFAMPELDFGSYFAFARGLDHNTAIIQYGVFKGWFSFEAYGWLFWLGAGGFFLFMFRQTVENLLRVIVNGLGETNERDTVLWLGLAILLTYHIGVVFSVVLGIDLMIRNERYMLVISPMLALGGAYFLHSLATFGWKRISDISAGRAAKDAVFGAYFVLTLILLLQIIVVGWYYRWRHVVPLPEVSAFTEEKQWPVPLDKNLSRSDWLLRHFPSINVVKKITEIVPDDAKVLSMRPADMYYADRRMISFLDPSLLPFYREKDPVIALQMLGKLGIRHVFMTDYSLPPVYNSSLLSILADPSLSRLVYSSGMTQLYILESAGQRSGELQDLTPGSIPWTRTLQLRVGGRKATGAFGFGPEEFKGGQSASSLPIFHRDYSVMLATGLGPGIIGGRYSTFIDVQPGGEYLVRMNLEGEGYVVLWLQQFDDQNISVIQPTIVHDSPNRIGDISLSAMGVQTQFARRFKLEPSTQKIRIGVEHVGRSQVTIQKMTLERVF